MRSWNHFLTLLLAGAGTLHHAEPTPRVVSRDSPVLKSPGASARENVRAKPNRATRAFFMSGVRLCFGGKAVRGNGAVPAAVPRASRPRLGARCSHYSRQDAGGTKWIPIHSVQRVPRTWNSAGLRDGGESAERGTRIPAPQIQPHPMSG